MKPTHIFLSDLHLDQMPNANTRRATREKLRKLKYQTVMTMVTSLKEKYPNAILVDCGDLFHTSTVLDNQGLGMALNYLNHIDYIIDGNHCSGSSELSISTFDTLKRIYPDKMYSMGVDERRLFPVNNMILLPHTHTQTAFKALVERACEQYGSKGYLLVTHCNIMSPTLSPTETTINLTEEMLNQISGAFDSVFIGHNHKPKVYKDTVHSIGCTFPTTFSDCNHDCSVTLYDQNTNQHEQVVSYVKSENYATLRPSDPLVERTFVRLEGEWDAETLPSVIDQLFRGGCLSVKPPQSLKMMRRTRQHQAKLPKSYAEVLLTYLDPDYRDDYKRAINYDY